MSDWTKRGSFLPTLVFGVCLSAAIGGGSLVSANEAFGELDLQVKLLDVAHGKGEGRDMQGVARVEVLLRAWRATENIRLSVHKPDGSSFRVGSKPFGPEPVSWRKVDGSEAVLKDGQATAGPKEYLRSIVVVPLQGAAVHEIDFRATGLASGRDVATGGMVRAALGVDYDYPVVKDGYVVVKPKAGTR